MRASVSDATLLGELLAERYNPGRLTPPGETPHHYTPAELGGDDNDISRAQRRRVLCEALDSHHHHHLEIPTEGAA
jgi:hypothetical protein